MSRRSSLALACGLVALGWFAHDAIDALTPAWAQGAAIETAAAKALREANARASANMNTAIGNFTMETDKDLASALIAHHVGAIDLAKIVIQYNGDNDIRQSAQAILALSEKEAPRLRDWISHQH